MLATEYLPLSVLRKWIGLMVLLGFCLAGYPVVAQSNSPSTTPSESESKTNFETKLSKLHIGPFDLHPRIVAGFTYDDNISYSTADKEADEIWTVEPALQAVAGDDEALSESRDQHTDILGLSPGDLIIQPIEDRPGKLLILDYGPRFQQFDKHTVNDSIDEFAVLNLIWSMDRLVLGLRQEYQLQKEPIIEAGLRTSVESIPTTISAAYEFSDKTSLEGDFHRSSLDYGAPQLIGFTEYSTEDYLNYKFEENLPVSLGVSAGMDDVANHQDQSYEQLRVRARYIHSEKLKFDVSAGGDLRQYQDGNPETLRPVFTASAEYQLAERTWLRLSGYRQQYASIFNGYNYARTGATLEARQGITDRFAASISAGYFGLQYTTVSGPLTTHTDGYTTIRIGLDAKFTRHLIGQVFAQWVNRQSQFNGGVDDNQTGVQFILSF